VEIVDISVPIRPGMIVYEGDPDVHLERVLSIADGARANQPARLRGVRSATHVDAPVHFIDSAGGTEALPLDALVGDPYVVDATAAETMIDEETLRELRLPEGAERLLFKTTNSRLWERTAFTPDFVQLRAGLASWSPAASGSSAPTISGSTTRMRTASS
jgi:arylformamidase